LVRFFEGEDAGEGDEEAEGDRMSGKLAAAGEAMQHRGESSPARFLLQYPRHVRVSLARMDDERQTGCARGGDVAAEPLFLRGARAALVVIVEPGLADCHHLRVTRALDQLVGRYIELVLRVMRMSADGAIHIIEALCDAEHLGVAFDSRRDSNNARDSGRPRARDHGLELAGESGKIEMAVAVDQHRPRLYALPSLST